MSTVIPLSLDALSDTAVKQCPPESHVAGKPTFRSKVLDESLAGNFRSGWWEMTPGTYRLSRNGTAEFCYILQGRAVITPDDGESFAIEAGSAFTLKPDFVGVWETIETIRKYWVIVSA